MKIANIPVDTSRQMAARVVKEQIWEQ